MDGDIATMDLSLSAGHDSCSPVTAVADDDLILVNGRPVLCVGDRFNAHSCRHHGSHRGTIVTGSSVMRINGRAVARVGDIIGSPCPSNAIVTGDELINIED